MKRVKSIFVSILLVLILLFSCTNLVFAKVNISFSESMSKFSNELKTEIELAEDDELIPVWIWFIDIDKKKAEKRIEAETGISADSFSELTRPNAEPELVDIFKVASKSGLEETEKIKLQEKCKNYLNCTEKQRLEKQNFFRTYRNTRIGVLKECYNEHNDTIINDLHLDPKDILFISFLTPSVIASVTKEELLKMSKEQSVSYIYFYDNSVVQTPSENNDMHSMHMDNVLSEYSFTGAGVNVLMLDLNYIRPDVGISINNDSNIYNVVNNTVYHYSNTTVLPNDNNNHATFCASFLKEYAPGATIYSIPRDDYSVFEWAVDHFSIDIINASICLGTPICYDNDGFSRWYDGLISSTGIPVIASAGNSEEWYESFVGVFPNVISPASCYNSIAVGAYISGQNDINQDTMHPYGYNPITNTNLVSYKPDVVVAAGDTSTGAPKLTGILACILQLENNISPEEIKAIFMASCHRKVLHNGNDLQENIADGLTEKQGAGPVDVYRAMMIVAAGNYGTAELSSSNNYSTEIQLLSNPNIDNHTLDYDDNVNVSISWLRSNSFDFFTPYHGVNLGTTQELSLSVLNSQNETIGYSNKTNSCKQMAYTENLNPNEIYSIKVDKMSNNNEIVTFGFAWSERGTKELSDIECFGNTCVGDVLSVSVQSDDMSYPSSEEVAYKWMKSFDGISWTTINDATLSSYQVTNNDFGCFIKCVVSPQESSLLAINTLESTTPTYVVIYGDINLNQNVEISDEVLLERYLADLTDLDDSQLLAADLNLDGFVEVTDLTVLQRYLNGTIDSLPV